MDIDIYQLPHILRRRWIYPAATTALCGVLALGFAMSQTPTYRASAELILDPTGFQNPVASATGAAMPGADQMAADSQLYVMQSSEVLGSVVDALKLQDDAWLAPPKSGGLLAHIFGGKLLTPDQRRQEAIASLRDDVTVTRADQSLVFSITAKHPVSRTAADIANATADAYLRMTDKSRSGSAQRASVSLKAQAEDLAAKLQKAQAEVEAYRAAHGLYSTPTKGLVADQQLEDLNQQLAAAKTRVEQQKTIFDQAGKISMADVEAGAIPEALQSSALVSLRTRLAQLLDAEAQLAANLGEQHPQLKAARSQVASMRASINAELERIRASLKNNYQRAVGDRDALQARYSELQKTTAETSTARTKLAQLQNEAQALRDLYQSTLAKAETLGGQTTMDPTSARVISAATPPAKTAGLPKWLIFAAGLLFGAAAGSALAVLREVLGQILAPGGSSGRGRRRPQEPANKSEPDPAPAGIVPIAASIKARPNAPVVRTSAVAQSEFQRAADIIRRNYRESQASRVDVLFYPTSGVADADAAIRAVAECLIEAGSVVLLSDGVETIAVSKPLIVRRGPRVQLAAPSMPDEFALLYRPAAGTSLIRQEEKGPVFHLANGAGASALSMLPGIIQRCDATMMIVSPTAAVDEIEDLMDSLSSFDNKLLGAVVTEEGA